MTSKQPIPLAILHFGFCILYEVVSLSTFSFSAGIFKSANPIYCTFRYGQSYIEESAQRNQSFSTTAPSVATISSPSRSSPRSDRQYLLPKVHLLDMFMFLLQYCWLFCWDQSTWNKVLRARKTFKGRIHKLNAEWQSYQLSSFPIASLRVSLILCALTIPLMCRPLSSTQAAVFGQVSNPVQQLFCILLLVCRFAPA